MADINNQYDFFKLINVNDAGNLEISTGADYVTNAALGNIDGTGIVNKFGFNSDVDTGSEEVIASFGGGINIMTTADTLDITSSDAADAAAGAGARLLLIQGIDENFLPIEEYVSMNGLTPVTTVNSYLGINRVYVVQVGTAGVNTGDITITDTSASVGVQAQIPEGKSVTQQCIYHTPINKTFLMDYIQISALKLSGGGGSPVVQIRGYSFSRVTNTTYNVVDLEVDTSIDNNLSLSIKNPITFTGREVIYFTAETDSNNTKASMRFSGIESNS